MKKTLFFVISAITFILLIDVTSKLISDIDRLTEYGWGFLAGKLILLLVFLLLLLLLYKKTFTKKSSEK
ncbi:hypothetical protein DVK85_03125 [Flavobacterium arcticum]|uniref:Uncharacterized protein n=1 Tax=Flavobacterium arcticum TaxID=1784713 RepID=A0A345H9L1_9FLAO|nr:hypothetical protein DVK85_03125 [Flavobacterium arcticum]